MRRVLIALALLILGLLAFSSGASAAAYKSCADVNSQINGKNYKIATKVKAKGVTCAQAKTVFIAYATGAGMLADPTLEALKNRCKDDKNQAASRKAKRIAVTCTSANGKRSLKAFVLGG